MLNKSCLLQSPLTDHFCTTRTWNVNHPLLTSLKPYTPHALAFGFLSNLSNTDPGPEINLNDETKNPKIKICWFDEFSKFGDHDLPKLCEKRFDSEESIPDDMKTLTYLEDF